MTVTAAVALLLALLGSVTALVTVALLLITLPFGVLGSTLATTVMVAELVLAVEPIVQVSGCVAAARPAYLIIEDPQDENRRLFLQAKNNLGPKGKGLAFRVEQRLISSDIVASNISWDTNHVTASVDEALLASENRGNNEGRSGKDEAVGLSAGFSVALSSKGFRRKLMPHQIAS